METDWTAAPWMALKPAVALLSDGRARHFWAYILTGMVIALVAHRWSGDGRPFARTFFARDVWLSQSAVNDYGILVLNPIIQFLCLSWLLAYAAEIAAWSGGLLRLAGVGGEATGWAALAAGAALTLTLFVVDDFMRWATHYVSHRVPVLWEFHKVHHSAETLNFATAERFHPVDVAMTSIAVLLTVGTVNAAFIALFGGHLTVATVAGANVLWVAFNVIGGVLRHSPAWISYGPRAERWVISPAMHQIHHSDNPRHFDRNFGGSLAVWDRMFGTLHIPHGREEVTGYGIGPETREYRTLSALYLLPFVKAGRRIGKWTRRALGSVPTRGVRPRGV